MANLILEETFGFEGGRLELQPASKSAVIEEFTQLFDQTGANASTAEFTVEDGETALAFLVEHDMIAIDGDVITLPARFAGTQVQDAAPGNPVETTP